MKKLIFGLGGFALVAAGAFFAYKLYQDHKKEETTPDEDDFEEFDDDDLFIDDDEPEVTVNPPKEGENEVRKTEVTDYSNLYHGPDDEEEEEEIETPEEMVTREHEETRELPPEKITFEDYANADVRWDQGILYFYKNQNILLDEAEEIITERELLVGGCLDEFAENDEDFLFIRNFALDTVFKIQKIREDYEPDEEV